MGQLRRRVGGRGAYSRPDDAGNFVENDKVLLLSALPVGDVHGDEQWEQCSPDHHLQGIGCLFLGLRAIIISVYDARCQGQLASASYDVQVGVRMCG